VLFKRTLRYARPLLLSVVLVSSGCGAGVSVSHSGTHCWTTRTSVAKARDQHQKQVVLVAGHYLRKNGVTRICDALIGSTRPNCGGASLVVTPGAGSPHTNVHHAHGIAWTTHTVTILGSVSGTTLHRVGCA
jgi:hypothetical protein